MDFKPNPAIAALAPYTLANLETPDGVPLTSLAQNEHVFPPGSAVIEAARSATANAHLYPDPDWTELRQTIAAVHAIEADGILCGAGSMALIAALAQAYLAPGERVLVTEYGYLFVRTATQMVGASLDVAAEKDFCVDIDSVLASVRAETKLLFLVNPGNPTGTLLANTEIRRLRKALPDHILLVVDEAYAEFTDPLDNPPLFDLVARGDTVVLRTFSKIYGLAGLRVGWGYFPVAIRDTLRKVINPNNISAPSQAAAVVAMRDQATMQTAREVIGQRRDAFAAGVRRLSLEVPVSHTNFVLIRFASPKAAEAAFAHLRTQGIIVRGMRGYGLADCLRITIGTERQMTDTLAALSA